MLNHSFSSIPSTELLIKESTLAVIPLIEKCEPSDLGVIQSGINEPSTHEINEVWSVDGIVSRGRSEASYWSKTSDLICVAHWLTEADCENIEQSTNAAYLSIFSVLREHGFAYPFRFWNYLPGINNGNGDGEVYKRFCTGRLKAFETLNIEPESFPAASALGHHAQGAVIYVFASSIKPQHFKNKKQVDAYNYPRQYGISSPSFARATALKLAATPYLFISGTASIVGHKTIEAGSLDRQLAVTSENIEHLLATANPDNRALSTFKVYVRHSHHIARTKEWLNQHYPNVDTVITVADICRKDLLVEIECFCQ